MCVHVSNFHIWIWQYYFSGRCMVINCSDKICFDPYLVNQLWRENGQLFWSYAILLKLSVWKCSLCVYMSLIFIFEFDSIVFPVKVLLSIVVIRSVLIYFAIQLWRKKLSKCVELFYIIIIICNEVYITICFWELRFSSETYGNIWWMPEYKDIV